MIDRANAIGKISFDWVQVFVTSKSFTSFSSSLASSSFLQMRRRRDGPPSTVGKKEKEMPR